MRLAFCLLLLFGIAGCPWSARADDKPLSWRNCPAPQPLPGFDHVQADTKPPDLATRQHLPTNVEGDRLSGTSTNPLYQGNVALTRGDQFLGADSLRIDTQTGNYIAQGHVRYQDASLRATADKAEGNQDSDTHQIFNIRYQLVNRRGNGRAKSIDIQGQIGRMYRSSYTTCDPTHPIWEVRAPRIEVDHAGGFGTAHRAVLDIASHPVMYLPWFKFPIDDRRRSGLLYPQLGFSSRNHFDYTQPIYLNLADNYDATLYPRWMSRRGGMLDTEFRYLYSNGRGIARASYMPDDRLRPQQHQRSRAQYSGYHSLNDYWQARAAINWISDTRYLQDFSNALQGMSSATSLYNVIGIYRVGDTFDASVMVDRWQLSDPSLDETALAYNREPRFVFDWDQPALGPFEMGLHSEAVRFSHRDSYAVIKENNDYYRTNVRNRDYHTGSRLDLKPFVSLPLASAAWYLKPMLAWRYTRYQLSSGLANSLAAQRRPTRSQAIVSVDAGTYFDRDTTVFGQPYLNTLEPRLFYLYVPYRDQTHLPVFDTRAFTFSWGQLFRDSRYSSADRQNDANQLTMAATSRWMRERDGQERLAISAGQILYFHDSKVTLDPTTRALSTIEQTRGKSAWVADVSANVNDRWTFGTTYQWNPHFRREDLASVRTRYLIGDDGVINLAYRYRRSTDSGLDQIKQIDASAFMPVSPHWSLVGRYYYSLLDRKPLEILGGAQWDSCCLAVRTLVRRYVRNRIGEQTLAFQLEIILKGLSSVGQDNDRILRQSILGYYRDDLYLVPPNATSPRPEDTDPNQIP